ncbi:MAG: carboxynorspermidine decarboxylase [Verrucomicrobiota bacterium]|nr:carboxynorspermidine decarboxylase [Verrucomicrobiota bacterium]
MVQDPIPKISEQRLSALAEIPFSQVPSPAYVVHLNLLEENGRILQSVAEKSGAKILLALKGFACHSTFPVLKHYLSGTTSSGLHESLLAKEHFGKEIHVYAPAYKENELKQMCQYVNSLVFNSAEQLALGLHVIDGLKLPQLGIRINPEQSEVESISYDSCSYGSRLGTTRSSFDSQLKHLPSDLLDKIDGFHFHALCEQDADALERTANAFEDKFGDLLRTLKLKWLNFGGGHHITRPGYDLERLYKIIKHFRKQYKVEVYLEPGEAVALHTGVLVSTVLDITDSDAGLIAIVDTSATCHMPDVLEMPYRPNIMGAGSPNVKAYNYHIGGLSCLASDKIGDYSFDEPLQIGQKLVFLDMAHYTMVKNTTFNGIPLPTICHFSQEHSLQVIRRFGYEDYRTRLS